MADSPSTDLRQAFPIEVMVPPALSCSCGPGCSCGCQSGGSCQCGGGCG